MSEIVVENIAPSNMKAGEQVLVEVSIDKSDVQGFAKMELVLPQGFIATPAETKGASFTFSERKVRFVWMTLPTEQNFTVSYYIECDPNFSGKYEVSGTFSYINDNQRVDFTIPVKHVFVTQDAVAQNENSNESSEEVTTETTSSEPNVSSVASSDMVCERTVTKLSDLEYQVDLRILNSNIEGFAKVVEVTPELAKTEKLQDAGATVTADKNVIKFVWFEMPVSPIIAVSYKVKLLSASGTPNISGKLSFVENNNPKEIAVVNESGAEAIAQNNTTSSNSTSETTEPNNRSVTTNETATNNTSTTENQSNVKEDPIAENTVKSENNAPKSNNSTSNTSNTTTPKNTGKPVTTAPSPEVGVNYKVQIMAAHRVVNKTYFQKVHRYSEGFNIENHEGWVKYTTGLFGEYKEARDERERLKTDYNSLPGPLVTAYNNGERITVQEALLITKQQWYK
ncbi:MAG: hypothetical protein R2809_13740 [Flavobacteriales bacterium]